MSKQNAHQDTPVAKTLCVEAWESLSHKVDPLLVDKEAQTSGPGYSPHSVWRSWALCRLYDMTRKIVNYA